MNYRSHQIYRYLSLLLILLLFVTSQAFADTLFTLSSNTTKHISEGRNQIGQGSFSMEGVQALIAKQPVKVNFGSSQVITLQPQNTSKKTAQLDSGPRYEHFTAETASGIADSGELFIFSSITLADGAHGFHLALIDSRSHSTIEVLTDGSVIKTDTTELLPCEEEGEEELHVPLHLNDGDADSAEYDPIQVPANDDGDGDDSDLVRVMVVYTPQALAGSGGTPEDPSPILAEISTMIALTNIIYADSEVNFQVELAYVHATDTDELNSETEASFLTYFGDGRYDEVHALRNLYEADLVALITQQLGISCGVAKRMRSLDGSSHNEAFSASRRSCAISNFTFPHELGHNLGLGHDRDNSDPPENYIFDYGFGHRFETSTGLKRTVMAYSPGLRIPHFSNPEVLYEGVPTGIVHTAPDAADASRVLNQTLPVARMYRPREDTEPLPAPAEYLPLEISATTELINGLPVHVATVTDLDGNPLSFISLWFGRMVDGNFQRIYSRVAQTNSEGKAYIIDVSSSTNDRAWESNVNKTLSNVVPAILPSDDLLHPVLVVSTVGVAPPKLLVEITTASGVPIPYLLYSLEFSAEGSESAYAQVGSGLTDINGTSLRPSSIPSGFYRVALPFDLGISEPVEIKFPQLVFDGDFEDGTPNFHLTLRTTDGEIGGDVSLSIEQKVSGMWEMKSTRRTDGNGELDFNLNQLDWSSLEPITFRIRQPILEQSAEFTFNPFDYLNASVMWPETYPGYAMAQLVTGNTIAFSLSEAICTLEEKSESNQWNEVLSYPGCHLAKHFYITRPGTFRITVRANGVLIGTSEKTYREEGIDPPGSNDPSACEPSTLQPTIERDPISGEKMFIVENCELAKSYVLVARKIPRRKGRKKRKRFIEFTGPSISLTDNLRRGKWRVRYYITFGSEDVSQRSPKITVRIPRKKTMRGKLT